MCVRKHVRYSISQLHSFITKIPQTMYRRHETDYKLLSRVGSILLGLLMLLMLMLGLLLLLLL